MSKGFLYVSAIVLAACLAFALAGGPGATGNGKTTRERTASQAQVQTQTQTQTQAQTQTRTQDPGAAFSRQQREQVQAQERTQERVVGGAIGCSDGAGPNTAQSLLPGKGDVQRDRDRDQLRDGSCQDDALPIEPAALTTQDRLHTHDRLRDGSCQDEDVVSTFDYLIEYDYDYEHLYGYDHEPSFHFLHEGPPPEGGYGG